MSGKVLLVYEQKDNTSEVNIKAMSALLKKGEADVHCIRTKDVREQDIGWCTACIAIRPSSLYAERIAKALSEAGRPFFSLLDDDLLSLPKIHPNYWRNRYLRKCIGLSCGFISPNPLLLEDLTKINPEARRCLLDAFVSKNDIKPVEPVEGQIKIVYPAGRDHAELFDRFVKPKLSELARKYGEKVVFIFVGVSPDLSGMGEGFAYEHYPLMPLEEYNKFMRSHRFDVGIAPLDDNHFSNRKYFIKYLEFAKNGIIGLYTKCAPYTFAIKDGYNGLMVGVTPQDWYDKLCYVIEHIQDCKAIAANSQNELQNRYVIDNVYNKFKNELPEVFSRDSSSQPVKYRIPLMGRYLYEVRRQIYRVRYHLIKKFTK